MKQYRLAYVFMRLRHILSQPILTLISRLLALYWGVELDGKVRFLGIPRFRNLGTIKIGNGTRIISDSRNLVGSYIKSSFETGVNGIIEIGLNCGISNCHIISQGKIRIDSFVYIGGGTRIYDNDFHSIDPIQRLYNPEIIPTKPIHIKSRAFIGGHSIILKGVIIGENSVLAAGSVLTRSIPPNEIWGGAPAKKIRDL